MMLLDKHKNYVMAGFAGLGIVITVVLAIIGVNLKFFGEGPVTSNRFSSYNMLNAKTVTNPDSNGMNSETLMFEFEEPESRSKSVKDNGFASIGFALQDMNKENPSIFNVHGVSDWQKGNIEFLFESLSPTDYESEVFAQSYGPFSRLANSVGFDEVKVLSTIDSYGSRHVTMKTTAKTGKLTAIDTANLWRQMLLTLSPVPENTSYDLTLTMDDGVTVHGHLSTAEEQEKMLDYDSNNWMSIFELNRYAGVQTLDFYVQGQETSENTVALTITAPESLPEYLATFKEFSEDPENKFPSYLTTTITVEDASTPAQVFTPNR